MGTAHLEPEHSLSRGRLWRSRISSSREVGPGMSFDSAIAFVLSYEAGYVNDPQDPGGETNFGISKRSYPSLDIKVLTRERAVEIYRKDFWTRCRCDDLPPGIAFLMMDTAVNQGPQRAVQMLQQALGVKADGVIGPSTIQAALQAKESVLIAEFVARRCSAYAMTANVQRYGLGWMRRAVSAHQAALGVS